MKKSNKIWICAIALLALFICLIGCSNDQLIEIEAEKINLRWIPAYEGEGKEQVETGLLWSLSFLGATLPEGGFQSAIRYFTDTQFELDISNLGFSEAAKTALRSIIKALKTSEEYEQHNAIDLGRFLVLTLHSSWHYYQITGADQSLEAFQKKYAGLPTQQFPVLNSSVAHVNRLLHFHISENISDMHFLAEETEENIDTTLMHQINHYEVFDIMPNGQLRFAIYDERGQLSPAAPVATTQAGKPSKCLWCHETAIQPLFNPTPNVEGFMTSESFQIKIDSARILLENYRAGLKSDIDFRQGQAHTQSELLYISFMEPSALRVANEWRMTVEEVKSILTDFPTHTFDEFPFLGDLYWRNTIDSLAPYQSLNPPASIREPNDQEPNLFD